MKIASLAFVILLTGCGTASAPTTTTPATTASTTTVDPTAARNASIIQIATAQAVALGLNVYANEGNQAEAVDIANKIKELVSATALPYLNGTTGATSAAINGFMNGQFVTLPSEAQSFISLAAALLDNYLPAPSATTVLNADQLTYIKAFFQGLNDGATQFLVNPPTAPATVTPAKPAAVKKDVMRSTAMWFNSSKE